MFSFLKMELDGEWWRKIIKGFLIGSLFIVGHLMFPFNLFFSSLVAWLMIPLIGLPMYFLGQGNVFMAPGFLIEFYMNMVVSHMVVAIITGGILGSIIFVFWELQIKIFFIKLSFWRYEEDEEFRKYTLKQVFKPLFHILYLLLWTGLFVLLVGFSEAAGIFYFVFTGLYYVAFMLVGNAIILDPLLAHRLRGNEMRSIGGLAALFSKDDYTIWIAKNTKRA